MPKLIELHEYFLSHAGHDKDLVKEVAKRMVHAGRDVFLDEWSIDFGESIPGAIEKALRDTEASCSSGPNTRSRLHGRSRSTDRL
ncbi:hypothetical protein QE375_003560 [Microbacterium foliorum]|uniref:TIR domain-containing protein n=1 Tax=Microbacterium foliorum TaxID=104336 RepID=A0ABU1HVB2_9MICO|nr:toll/interleukin-1 receptor domain-containing protein [Microbacterium foliorum]MDR6144006.1 hypothetical protein [Microbacterium foliorum]